VQLSAYSADIGRFAEVGVQVLAISPQSVAEHEEFSEAHGPFAFPLLSDEDKEVAKAYGILGPIGFYRRSVVVVDAGGVVRWVHRATAGLTFRPVDEIVAAVEALDP
jgi:peroxiredoxin Q/BCP